MGVIKRRLRDIYPVTKGYPGAATVTSDAVDIDDLWVLEHAYLFYEDIYQDLAALRLISSTREYPLIRMETAGHNGPSLRQPLLMYPGERLRGWVDSYHSPAVEYKLYLTGFVLPVGIPIRTYDPHMLRRLNNMLIKRRIREYMTRVVTPIGWHYLELDPVPPGEIWVIEHAAMLTNDHSARNLVFAIKSAGRYYYCYDDFAAAVDEVGNLVGSITLFEGERFTAAFELITVTDTLEAWVVGIVYDMGETPPLG